MTGEPTAVALARQAFETEHGMAPEDSPRWALNQSFDCLVQALEQTRHLEHLRASLANHAEEMELIAETDSSSERRRAATESAQLWRALALVVASVQAQRAETALANRKG